MNLTRIEIENFQSYYDKSFVDIENNLNLFLGTVGAGKSKLFNAFYWCFFGEIYKNLEGWCSIDSSKFLSVFNKKKLRDASVNDIVNVRVELKIQSDKEYAVSRQIEIQRINDEDFNSEKNWKFIKEDLAVSFDSSDGNRVNIDINYEAREYIHKKLLPKDISKYIWFQGETLDELIDINNGKLFKQAVNFISYIGYYDNNIALTRELIDKTEKTLRREKKKDTSNEKEFNKISQEIEDIEGKLPSLEESLVNKVKELQEIDKVIFDIDKRLDDINEFIDLKNRKENLERERKYTLEEIDKFDKNVSNHFSKYWILLGTEPLLKAGFEKLHSYQKWYEECQNNNPTGLPFNIPDPKYLNEMLQEKKCYICGEEFGDNSNAYKHIENRLKHATGELEELRLKNKEQLDINNKVVDILSCQPVLLSKVSTIKADIIENKKRNNELNLSKIKLTEEINEINDKITLLQEKHGNKITANFSIEKGKYNYNITERNSINSQIAKTTNIIHDLNQELKQKKEELNKIPTKSNVEYKEEKILLYLNELYDAYTKIKDIEFDKLISHIENKANDILQRITQANNVINGKICIDRDTYVIKLIDIDNSNSNRDINTGHLTMTKMCVINAIVLISNEYKNKSYPFITDAPTSDLDDGTAILYYKALDEEFNQSIVMTKDLFTYKEGKNVVDKTSLKGFNFRNVFQIEKAGATIGLTESNSYSLIHKII